MIGQLSLCLTAPYRPSSYLSLKGTGRDSGRNASDSSVSSFTFGFNGKEKDDEVQGNGNQYDYGFRIYNPRIGKFLSVDPLTKEFPWWTPYQFAGNTPIQALDLDGLEILDYRSLLWAQVGKVEFEKTTEHQIVLMINQYGLQEYSSLKSNKTVNGTYKGVPLEVIKAANYTMAPALARGKGKELKNAQLYSNNNPVASNTAAAGAAALMLAQSTYEASKVPNSLEARDIFDAKDAFERANEAVNKYSVALSVTLGSEDIVEHLQFRADVINYVVDKRLGEDVQNRDLVKGWGEFILKKENLNDKKPSNQRLSNQIWNMYLKVTGP